MKPTQRERELIRGMEGKLHELALFAGAGGGILGTHLLGCRVVGAVELDMHARQSLIARQRDSGIGCFPVWNDCRSFDGSRFRGLVDIVNAGFPCPPFSCAGKQKAAEDKRNMWPETARILREVRPAVALLENVDGLLSRGHGYFQTVVENLIDLGFDFEWGVLGASGVGARHRRQRIWLLAYSVRNGAREVLAQLAGEAEEASIGARWRMRTKSGDCSDDLADADGQRFPGRKECDRQTIQPELATSHRNDADRRRSAAITEPGLGGVVDGLANRVVKPWEIEPGCLPRVASGVRDRVARLRAIGNGQVPLCAAVAWRLLARRALDVIR